MKLGYVTLLLILTTDSSGHPAFQGSCSSHSSLCDEICLSLSDDTYECDCWTGNRLKENGFTCEVADLSFPRSHEYDRMKIRRLTIKEEEWMETIKTATADNSSNLDGVLSFDRHNYAHFVPPESAYLETNVSVEFRSDSQSDGLLFFGGMFAQEDFLSLAIVAGNIVLRYDCGEGISTETYYGPFSLHKWHSIHIKRTYCTQSEITVDQMATVKDNNKLFKTYKGITMTDGFFLGGAPSDVEFLDSKTTVSGGFRGCVRHLTVNELVLLDASKNINKMLNRELIKPCQQLVSVAEEPIFDGLVRKIDIHHEPKKPTTTSTTKVVTTKVTTPATTIATPRRRNLSVEFNGALFLEQPSPIEIEQYLDLEIQFKPKRNKGLLFHWADVSHRLSIILLDGFVVVEMSLGGDEQVIKSASPVSLHTWHSAQVYRSGLGILMKVDKQRFVDTEVGFTDSRRIKAGKTFIGGSNIKLPSSIMSAGNFFGCIRTIRLNTHLLSLIRTPSLTASAEHVDIPASLPSCSSDPCSKAKCGSDCVASVDLTKYSCLCSFPSYGEECGSTFSMVEGAFSLNGDGYLELINEAVMDHITGDELKFSMEMKHNGTVDREQILAYAGEIEESNDFMQIGINKERKITVSMNLGAGEVQLTHGSTIPDGKWTTIDVIRTKRTIRVTVDSEGPVSAEAPEGSEQLNVYNALWIGGRSPHVHLRDDGFRGCIEWIKIDNYVVTSPRQATKSVNVAPCHSVTTYNL